MTEEIPANKKDDNETKHKITLLEHLPSSLDELLDVDPRKTTLTIDIESVCVHEVSAVKIQTDRHSVTRYRFEDRDVSF